MEIIIFLGLLVFVYVGAKVTVDFYFKHKKDAWKTTSPLLGVVAPITKSQTNSNKKSKETTE